MTNPLCPKTERERDEARAERDSALTRVRELELLVREAVNDPHGRLTLSWCERAHAALQATTDSDGQRAAP